MYISELDLHGFKSFAHKTKVTFDSGITAIVGPNGCGKSNIVDALRWVLGEQRPTLLRSASMSNVIFNGTAGKKALGLAEVSLSLINNKGILPTEYSEVTITRRLYRSGESEYLLNNSSCRLKDIMDLFMDTGMGADAYSVIELKMVEEILNDRNNDRRRLFEEAAGVTRYKEKRRQTMRKLDETDKDLQRIDDILQEVRKKTRSLEIQAEKASRAKNLRSELEKLDRTFNRNEYRQVLSELEPLKKRIQHAEKEKREIASELEEQEEQEEQSRQSLLKKERTESETRRRASQLESSVREMETAIRITREKISNEKGVIRQYEDDIRQSHKDLEELEKVKESSREQLDNFSSDLDASEKSLKESRDRFTEVQQQYTGVRHRIYELEIETGDAGRKLSDLQTERVKLESKLENTEDDLTRILSDKKNLSDQIEDFEREKTGLDKKSVTLEKKKAVKLKELEKATGNKDRLEAEIEQAREEVRMLRSKKDALESEVRLINELAESKEFFPSSISYLTEHHSDRFRLMETVGNVIHTDEDHAPALEAALGETINYMIVETMEEAVRASELLKRQEQGRATFIPMSELKPDYPAEKHSVLSVVDVDRGYGPLAKLLLGSVLLAENVNQAKRLLELGGSAAVTREGDLITADRFLRSGSQNSHAGVRLGLKDKLEKLEVRLNNTGRELRSGETALDKLEKELSGLNLEKIRREVNELDKEIRKWDQQLNRVQSNIHVYRKNIVDLENRQESLSSSENTAKGKLQTLNPKEHGLREKIEKLDTDSEEKKQLLQKLEEERAIAQNRFNDAQLKHQDLENKTGNLKRDLHRAETGIAGIRKRLETREELTRQSRQKIDGFSKDVTETGQVLEQKKKQKAEIAKELKLAEEACSQVRGKIREFEKELKDLRRRKEVNLELVHHLVMAKEKFEMQAQSLSDHVWETYGILMKQITDEVPEDFDAGRAKTTIAELRQKLSRIGEVNPLAIEEFTEEKNRLEFLETQIRDLHDAKSQLRETISEINQTATERFNKTFEQIRVNFQSVFSTLFQEDDYCDLLIEKDVEDPLEAKIEIRANPKGKRPSGINQLSGGEKTLTAIALLFAIYLVKPSPFCVLDEVDAPLDDANIERFAKMIRDFSKQTQFIIITHNKKTMSKAEMMYGVTMPETGVSRLVGVKLDEISAA
ncbi:MAG: chromosome segregation protein SMC [Balneolaceae bacterium]